MVVSARDFRANQSKYIGIAHRGEEVILKSRSGSVRLIPISTEVEPGKRLKFTAEDSSLFEEDLSLLLPDRNLSVEELETLILDDIHNIYSTK